MHLLLVLLLVLQALGLEVRSVLAIGGIGGLAIGLAGREICENLLNGFLLMTTVRKAGCACKQQQQCTPYIWRHLTYSAVELWHVALCGSQAQSSCRSSP